MKGKPGPVDVILLLKEKLDTLASFFKKLFPTLQKQIGILLFSFCTTLLISHFDFVRMTFPISEYWNLFIFPVPFFLSIFWERLIFKLLHFFFAMMAGTIAAYSGEPFAAMVIFLPALSLAYEYDLYKSKFWLVSFLKHAFTFGAVYYVLSLGNHGPYAKGFGVEFRWILLMYSALLLMQLIWWSRMQKSKAWDKEQWEKSELARLEAIRKVEEKDEDLRKVTDAAEILIQGRKRSSWHGTN